MATYPAAVVTSSELPTRNDGQVIYGSHMNAVQDEVIAIETVLGQGNYLRDGQVTLVARLADLRDRLALADSHRAASVGVHGLASTSNVVGTDETQTLNNKTLVSPIISGTASLGTSTLTGAFTVSGNVVFSGAPTFTGALTIGNFTNAQHDHSSASKGGNVPVSSITSLQSLLDGKAALVHGHSKADISDFTHPLSSHTGTIPNTSVTGLGTSSTLNVAAGAGASAGPSQVVRGDDPRLTDGRSPGAHNYTHFTSGTDPLAPSDIGAATASHTHVKANVTDFQHTLNSHTGDLDLARVTGLQTALDGKLGVNATAVNSTKVGGRKWTSATTAPAGPAVGDVWVDY